MTLTELKRRIKLLHGIYMFHDRKNKCYRPFTDNPRVNGNRIFDDCILDVDSHVFDYLYRKLHDLAHGKIRRID